MVTDLTILTVVIISQYIQTAVHLKLISWYVSIISQCLKLQHLFVIQTLSKLAIGGNCLNIIKATYENPTVNIILSG